MKNVILAGVAALALVAGTQFVQAAEVVNEDDTAYNLMIAWGGDPDQIETAVQVNPRSTLSNLCQGCTISFGGRSYEADRNTVAHIRGGKLETQQKTN